MNPNNQDPIMVSPQPDTPSGTPPNQPEIPLSTFGQPTTISPNSSTPTQSPIQSPAPSQAFDPFKSSYQPQAPPQPQPATPILSVPSPNPQPLSPAYPTNPVAQTTPYPVNQTSPYAPLPSAVPPQPGAGIGGVGFTPPPASGMPAAYVPPKPPKKSHRKLLIGSLAGVFIALLGVGYLMFFYLPNTPNNVWKTSMNRSGRALTALSTQATEKDALETFSKSKMVANVNGSGEGMSFNGVLDTKFDKLTSNSDFKFNAKADSKNINLGLKLLSELQAGKQYPDIYFQFVGLKAIGFDQMVPGLAKYEGKWITVDSEYIASNTTLKENAQAQTEQLTAAEVAEMAKVVTDVSDEYVFTSDPSKAVIEQRSFVAKEQTDGKDTYHYKVGINTENSKTYCRTLVERVLALPSAKRLAGDGAESLKTDLLKDCDGYKGTTKDFDMWIDAKYKLIYKVRIYDPDDNTAYADIGQDYKGTDDVTGFINYVDTKYKTEVQSSVTINLKSKTTSGKIDIKSNGSSPFNVSIDMKIEPYEGSIDVNEPAGSIPIQQVIDAVTKSTR